MVGLWVHLSHPMYQRLFVDFSFNRSLHHHYLFSSKSRKTVSSQIRFHSPAMGGIVMKPHVVAAFVCWGLFLVIGVVGMQMEGDRIGAVAKDGWVTDATGQGAASHHGGVDHWVYEGGSASGIYLVSFLFFIAGWVILICGCIAEDKKEKREREAELKRRFG